MRDTIKELAKQLAETMTVDELRTLTGYINQELAAGETEEDDEC